MLVWLKNIGIEVSKILITIYLKQPSPKNHLILSIWTNFRLGRWYTLLKEYNPAKGNHEKIQMSMWQANNVAFIDVRLRHRVRCDIEHNAVSETCNIKWITEGGGPGLNLAPSIIMVYLRPISCSNFRLIINWLVNNNLEETQEEIYREKKKQEQIFSIVVF